MADESRRLIKGLMARFVRVTAICDAGNNMGKVDCTQQVDDEDIGQCAKDHRQQPDTEPAIAEVDATDICDDEHVCFLK